MGDILFVDGGLVFEEQRELRLGHRVALDGDLEAVCWFNGELGSRINGSFDIVVLAQMDS